MKFFLSIIFFSIIIPACIQKNRVPKEILGQHEMTHVMWDLLKADELVYNNSTKDSTINKKQESVKLYEQVFRIHGTSREKFEKSLAFYQNRPDLLKVVMDSLRNFEGKFGEAQSRTPFFQDSIESKIKLKRYGGGIE